MGLSEAKPVHFAETSYELGVALQYFVEHLAIVNVVAPCFLVVAVRGCGWWIVQQLIFLDYFEIYGLSYLAFGKWRNNVLRDLVG